MTVKLAIISAKESISSGQLLPDPYNYMHVFLFTIGQGRTPPLQNFWIQPCTLLANFHELFYGGGGEKIAP